MPTVSDENIKTVWIDRMQLLVRSDAPIGTISFATLIPPDRLVEVGRFQTTVPHLKAIVDLICRNIDYYPTKSSPKPGA
jgi:hypothetical protein